MARGEHSRADMPKAKLTKENFKESLIIFRYIKPYLGKFITGLVFIGLSAGTTMAFPYLLKKLIDSAHATGPLTYWASPTGIALTMAGVLVLQMIISFMRVLLFTTVGENAVADMRKDIYRHIITMPMDFFAQRRVGELSSRISADVS